MQPPERNYNTISPSAKWVLMMKGHTTLPYARQTAELLNTPEESGSEVNNDDLIYWIRTSHFETRYLGVDQLLEEIPVHNILELSSGFSFRGLDFTTRKNVHYIDTDLPNMIAKKKDFISQIDTNQESKKGKLEILPLNALDEDAFKRTVQRFDEGPVAIVNEGLLLYLDTEEKQKLAKIIHDVLKERGGYWITGDIYLKLAPFNFTIAMDEKTKKFFEDHDVEAKRFDSLEQAEEFFRQMGFIVDKEANVDYTKLSVFPQIVRLTKPEDFQKMGKVGKIHATWRLRLAGNLGKYKSKVVDLSWHPKQINQVAYNTAYNCDNNSVQSFLLQEKQHH